MSLVAAFSSARAALAERLASASATLASLMTALASLAAAWNEEGNLALVRMLYTTDVSNGGERYGLLLALASGPLDNPAIVREAMCELMCYGMEAALDTVERFLTKLHGLHGDMPSYQMVLRAHEGWQVTQGMHPTQWEDVPEDEDED
jgi:hypothetical protein